MSTGTRRFRASGSRSSSIALGGSRRQVNPSREACALALAAAEAVGADFVGVDLLPLPDGGYVVLELNGAVDFTSDYSLGGRDVFEEVADVVCSSAVRLDTDAARCAAELDLE
jgi:tetrahydromethanopterin:alpha-L-glutamate ligase